MVRRGPSSYSGMVLDVSRSGLFVQTSAGAQPGDEISVSLARLPSPIGLSTEVVWLRNVPQQRPPGSGARNESAELLAKADEEMGVKRETTFPDPGQMDEPSSREIRAAQTFAGEQLRPIIEGGIGLKIRFAPESYYQLLGPRNGAPRS